MKQFIKTTLKEYLNENLTTDIKFKKSVDEDRTTLTAYIGGIKVGSLIMEILFEPYQYEFYDIIDEDTFYELYPESEIVKIEHIKVDEEYRNSGVASKLMKRGIRLMKENGLKQFYLNASPIGSKGLNKKELLQFYKKFGFKKLLDQGNNVLMIYVKNT